jgi:hypothetical protein
MELVGVYLFGVLCGVVFGIYLGNDYTRRKEDEDDLR